MDKIEKIDKSLKEAEFEYTQSLNEMPANQEEEKMIYDSFIAGAEWQKEQVMKEAVEADVNTYEDLVLNYGCAEFVVDMPFSEIEKFGDKVRIVILKEKEE